MLLFIRWLRSGRGGRLARFGVPLLLLALIALLAARVAAGGGWSGVGAVPAFVIVGLIGGLRWWLGADAPGRSGTLIRASEQILMAPPNPPATQPGRRQVQLA
jgi:hypothetical protein